MSEFDNPNTTDKQNKLSFLEHLEALRWLFMRVTVAILVFGIVAFIFIDELFEKIIFAPMNMNFWTYTELCKMTHKLNEWVPSLVDAETGCFPDLSMQVMAPKMTTQFMTAMLVSFIAGIIFSFPYIIWEIWRFIRPALYHKEQKGAKGLVFWISLLFILGILFGYYLVAPMSIHFLGSFSVSSQIQNLPSLDSYMGTLFSTVLASGVMFELPVLVYFLSKLGLTTPEGMRKYRKHSIVVTLIVAAVITPPDVFSQIIISIPIILLYEVSIFISAFIHRNKKSA
jgi:sec-independent protein translocase protein TatC